MRNVCVLTHVFTVLTNVIVATSSVSVPLCYREFCRKRSLCPVVANEDRASFVMAGYVVHYGDHRERNDNECDLIVSFRMYMRIVHSYCCVFLRSYQYYCTSVIEP